MGLKKWTRDGRWQVRDPNDRQVVLKEGELGEDQQLQLELEKEKPRS